MELDTVLIAGLACFFLVATILDRIGLGPGLALGLTGWLVAWLVASGTETETVGFASIDSFPRWITVILAPWVFRHGVELGRLCRGRFSLASLLPGSARVTVTVLFLGALAYLWFPWGSWRQPEPGADRWLASLLLAAAWAIPATALRLTVQGGTRVEGRHVDQGAWSALLGIVAFTSLLIAFKLVSTDTGTLSAGGSGAGAVREALIPAILAIAAGIVSGVAGSFLGRLVGPSRSRVFTDLASVYIALLLAGLASGAELVAPFFAGATRGFTSLTASEAESDSARLFWRHTGTLTMGVVFVLGADAVAHSLFSVEVLSLALTLWGAGLLVQLLVSGALVLIPRRDDSFRRSWTASIALGWGYHPGALAVGFAAAGGLLTNDEMLSLPEGFAATFFAVVLVASLLQGASAPLFFKLFRPPDRASWHRWREQDGFRVALSACSRELNRLHANGLVGDEQAESIRRVLQDELRDLDIEQSDVLSHSPDLERARWSHALELLLVSAGTAVARASESGHIPPATATRVRKRLAERIDRLSELSVEETLRRPVAGHEE